MNTLKLASVVAPLALACLACSPSSGPGPATDSGISSLGGDGDGGTGDGDGDGDGDEDGAKLDMQAPNDAAGNGGDDEAESCQKVDLLFVIDNSGSMADEQTNLVNSFPAFIDEIQTQLADTDGYHVGVVSSDAYLFNQGCPIEGAMVTATGGTGSSNAVCGPYSTGQRYMTEADDLAQTFACAARVGTEGDGNERPMLTMQRALSPELNGPGGCNEGFLRDDALLVIVIITDEEDDFEAPGCAPPQPGSGGDPQAWFDAVVASKGGLESNVVVLALVGPPGPDPAACPALDKCTGGIIGAEVAARITQFTELFTNGFVGQVCAPSYASFFQEAVGVIKSACDDFEPIG